MLWVICNFLVSLLTCCNFLINKPTNFKFAAEIRCQPNAHKKMISFTFLHFTFPMNHFRA